MMEKKYKLTEETINVDGRTLYRIEALKDFDVVEKGDKGGFIENESNLSQSGDCWVYGNAKVSDNAMVCGNAKVYDNARVYYNALVCGNALVFGNALVIDKARVYGNASVYDNALVCGNALVYDNARVFGNAEVCDNAQVFGDAYVYGYTKICGSAEIKNNTDYIVFKNWWSSGRYFTWTRSNNMWRVGCFYGTGEELIAKAYKDSELSGKEYERVVIYVETMLLDGK